MKKFEKQKIISNLYYNIVIFSFIVSSHNISTETSYLKLDNNIRLEKYQESNNTVIDSFSLAMEESLINQQLYKNQEILASEHNSQYSGMSLSYELEDNLKELAESTNIPYEVLLTIGYRESDGAWNNNGVISPTNDYGLFQINECNLSYIQEQLGYTKEEILNDDLRNAEACILLLNDIVKRDDVDTLEDIFGMYNGWTNWKNKPQSVEYVKACMEIMKSYFPNYEYQKVATIK